MKTIIYLLTFLAVGSWAVSAAVPAKTAGGIYTESYAAQMRNQMKSNNSAEIRAKEYDARYERCDEAHRCGENQEKAEPLNPFLLTPAWQ